jgi:glutamine transport system permease protein
LDILILLKQSLPSLLSGAYVTLQITVISLVIATIIGLTFGMMSISGNKVLKIVATIYVDILRGTPLIVQAIFIYFAIPAAFELKIPVFVAGVLCISLNAGAYMVEIFRAGVIAVDKGQMEAARSLGLPYGKTMKLVILPQAIRNMIPAIINQFIISLKDTSLLSVIGIRELTQSGEIIIATTYRVFETWSFIAIFYFIMIMALTYAARYVERRLQR